MVDALDISLMCDKKYGDMLNLIEDSIESMSETDFAKYQKLTEEDTSYSGISMNLLIESFDGGYIDKELEDLIDDIVDEMLDTDGTVIDSVAGI